MKKIFVLKILCLSLICFSINYAFGQPNQDPDPEPTPQALCNSYALDQLIIEIDTTPPGPGEVTGTDVFTNLGGVSLGSIIDPNYYSIYLVRFDFNEAPFSDIEEALEFYECGGTTFPTGQTYKTKDADLNYRITSNFSTGTGANYNISNYEPYSNCSEPYLGLPTIVNPCNNLKIGIVDSGFRPGTPFDNQVLMHKGYDFVHDDPIALGGNLHGTMVTSVIAGETSNNNDDINFIPVQVLDDDGVGTYWNLLRGIDFSIDRADITNVSLELLLCNYDTCNNVFETLLDKVDKENKLVIGAAGNDGVDIDKTSYYVIPGSGQGENLIVVGGSACFLNPVSTSNIGANNVDLFAPSENILVYPSAYASGTSFAAPQVTSIAAIQYLTMIDFEAEEIKDFILENVIDRGWYGESVTGGTFDYTTNFVSTCSGGGNNLIENSDPGLIENSVLRNAYFSDNNFSLSISSPQFQNSQVQIIDLSGKIILNQSISLEKGNNIFNLNIERYKSLPTGLYLISIQTDSGNILTQKCVKLE